MNNHTTKCPYCGAEYPDARERHFNTQFVTDGETEYGAVCSGCERTFHIVANVEVNCHGICGEDFPCDYSGKITTWKDGKKYQSCTRCGSGKRLPMSNKEEITRADTEVRLTRSCEELVDEQKIRAYMNQEAAKLAEAVGLLHALGPRLKIDWPRQTETCLDCDQAFATLDSDDYRNHGPACTFRRAAALVALHRKDREGR